MSVLAPMVFHTTRDLVIPAGTRLINLSGKLVFGSCEAEAGFPLGLSTGVDNALELGVIAEGEAE
ncbi:hypothetical protein ACFPIF_15590 [Brevundimonas faecalis]|uniref:hypothetical protein n=1 Tax=Brevundimonas faecalis TaxID=947378 RepID=UPI003611DCE9